MEDDWIDKIGYLSTIPIELIRLILLKGNISSGEIINLYYYLEYIFAEWEEGIFPEFKKVLVDKSFWKLKDPSFEDLSTNERHYDENWSIMSHYDQHSKSSKAVNILWGLLLGGYSVRVYYKDIPTIDYLNDISVVDDFDELIHSYVRYKNTDKGSIIFKMIDEDSDSITILHYFEGKLYPTSYESSLGNSFRKSFYNFFYNQINMHVIHPSKTPNQGILITNPTDFVRMFS